MVKIALNLPNCLVHSLENNKKNYCHQISFLKPKCTRFDFGWGSSDPAGGAHSAPQTSSCILGLLLLRKRREREENKKRKKTEEREKQKKRMGKEGERRQGPQYTFLATPLRKRSGEGQRKGRERKGQKN